MRALCFADLHLGAGAQHRRDALADQEALCAQIVELARSRSVDCVLAAGDIFHRPKPEPRVLHIFAWFTAQLALSGIPTIAVHGNVSHDLVNGDDPSALELFATDWFRVSRTPELIRAAGDVAVVTLPSVPLSRLVAARGGGDRAETAEMAAQLLLETAAEIRGQVPEGWPSVLLGHWSVSGASLPNGLPVAALLEPVLDLETLEGQGWDAIVVGHIHRPQVFESAPFVSQTATLYCGSPMTHDFGEAGFEHGVWIVDLADTAGESHTAPEFVALTDRRFVTINVDLPALMDPAASSYREAAGDTSALDETDLIAALIAAAYPLEGAVVRVTYRATEEQHRRVDHQTLLALLEEYGVHRVYGGIQWDPVRETRVRVEGVDETLGPLEAVQMWCDANNQGDDLLGLAALTQDYLDGEAAA